MRVKKQHLKLDMEQQNDSKLRKEFIKAVYCHLAYLTSMQSNVYVSQMALWQRTCLPMQETRV